MQADNGLTFLGHDIGAHLPLGEAFLGTSFNARRTLNALEVINLPSAGGTIYGNGMGGAFSLAQPTEDADINLIINLAAGGRRIRDRFSGVGHGGRFRKEGF